MSATGDNSQSYRPQRTVNPTVLGKDGQAPFTPWTAPGPNWCVVCMHVCTRGYSCEFPLASSPTNLVLLLRSSMEFTAMSKTTSAKREHKNHLPRAFGANIGCSPPSYVHSPLHHVTTCQRR